MNLGVLRLPLLLLLCFSLLGAFIFVVPAAADDALTLRVGIYDNNPKIFTDEDGNAAGFWPEIIEYIAAEEGWQIEYVPGSWAEGLDRLANNEIDIMPDVAYTEERAALYAFSDEVVYVSWSRVYTREGAGIESVLDLEGKSVAVMQGSVNVEGPDGIKVLVSSFDVDCTFIEVDSYSRVFEMVESGEADAGVASKDFGYQHEEEFNLLPTGIIFQPGSLYFAFPQDSSLTPYLIAIIDSHVQTWKAEENSIYYQALSTWLGIELAGETVIPDWLKWTLGAVAGLLLLLGGAIFLMRYHVRMRTKALREEMAQRRQADERIMHLNSVLRALRNVNQLITRESDRERLIQESCDILVETRGYEKVWILLVDENKKPVSVVASGLGKELLSFLKQMKEGKYPNCLQELLSKDEPFLGLDSPGKEHAGCILAERHRHRGVYRCKLENDGKLYGALGVTLPSEMFADEGEKDLFLELSGDISFALKAIEDEEKRRQADEALRKSEEHFRLLVEGVKDYAIFMLDPDGNVVSWNEGAERIKGYKAEEIIGQHFSRFYGDEDIKSGKALVELQVAKAKGRFEDEGWRVRKDGSRFWASVVITALWDKDGNLHGFSKVTRDITERKRADERIMHLNSVLRALRNVNQLITRESDRERLIQESCDILVETRGYEKVWILLVDENKKPVSVVASGLGKELLSFLKQMKEGKYPNCLQELLSKDEPFLGLDSPGKEHAGCILAERHRHRGVYRCKLENDGKLYGALGVTLPSEMFADEGEKDLFLELSGDISFALKAIEDEEKRRQAEGELLRSEAGLAEAQRMAHIGSWELDFVSNTLTWSDEVYRIFGMEPQQFGATYEAFLDNIHPDDREMVNKAYTDSVKTRTPYDIVHRLLLKDSTVKYVNERCETFYDDKGKPLRSVGTVQDITERKHHDVIDESRLQLIQFAITHSLDELLEETLNEAEKLTDSLIGFYHFVEDDQQALTLQSWSTRTKAEFCRAEGKGSHYSIAEAGVWVDCVYQRKPVIHNDYASLPHRKGMPEGHAEVIRELVVPVLRGGKIKAILGVGNKPSDYTEQDVQAISLLADLAWEVAERKQAEEALQDEKDKLQLIIDSMEYGISIHDKDYNILYQSHPSKLDGAYHTGEKCYWAYEGRDEVCEDCPMIKAFKDGKSHATERKLVSKTGKVIFLENTIDPMRNDKGEIVSCVEVSRDITERKRAEEALQASEEKYKNLVEATSDLIWETDENGLYTFVSPQVKDILGYEVDEVVGKKRSLDFAPKEEKQKWLEAFREINAHRRPFFGFEMNHLHRNGNTVICEISGIPVFDGDGGFKGFVGINKDITERRQMQQQLFITDRLASVGELASGVAHELNNPLTGVIGFAQLLLERDIPDDVREDVDMVYREAQRAAQVVKNLLTFARKHPQEKQMLNINKVIEEVLELRAYTQRVENINVVKHLADGLPEVKADYFQLQQVFINIIINAEFFMKEAHNGGTLTITTEKAGRRVRAIFADDGPGIAEESLGHLFDPFFTTKEVGKGTGLGLSICHGIVVEHDGRMYAESKPGEGATFTVELPIGKKQPGKGEK